MKTRIFGFLLLVAILFSAISTQESLAQKSTKPIKGQVVSFNDLVMGGKGTITKEQAKDLAEKGNPIVLKSGKTVYFV